jgi:hypothetical protein
LILVAMEILTIPATSAKLIMTDRRRGRMLPSTLGLFTFLRILCGLARSASIVPFLEPRPLGRWLS